MLKKPNKKHKPKNTGSSPHVCAPGLCVLPQRTALPFLRLALPRDPTPPPTFPRLLHWFLPPPSPPQELEAEVLTPSQACLQPAAPVSLFKHQSQSSRRGSVITNPTRIREDVGLVPGPTQWVKVRALP